MSDILSLVQNEQEPQTLTVTPLREEVDIQISTARKYPRSVRAFLQRAMSMATLDEETAASCFYSIKRGPKVIEGPSIRLAEIVASSWGNIRFSGRVVAEEKDCVVAVGTAHDLETNVATSIEVRRRILDRDGKRFNSDMIVTTGNAATAIAMRNVIFKIIPKSYVDNIWAAAKKVAIGDATTLITRRQKAVDHFLKMGVSKEQVLKYLDKSGLEEIGLNELDRLIGLITSLKEGEITLEAAFPAIKPVEDMTPKKKEPTQQAVAQESKKEETASQPQQNNEQKITAKSIGRLLKDMETAAVTQEEFLIFLQENTGIKTIKEIKEKDVELFSQWILSQNSQM